MGVTAGGAAWFIPYTPVTIAVLENDGDPTRHAVLHSDLRDVKGVWKAAMKTGVLDPDKPIGLLMVSVLHWVHPQEGLSEVVGAYKELLPSGSHLIMSHCTLDEVPDEERQQLDKGVALYFQSGNPAYPRHPDVIRRYFDDFELVDPGLVWLPEWHVEDGPSRATALLADRPAACCFLGGIGVKP